MKRVVVAALLFLLIPVFGFSTAVPSSPTLAPKIAFENQNMQKLASTRQAKWANLLGTWFGTLDIPGGGKYMWITENKPDGTYKDQFRIVDPAGKRKEKIEVGEWGVSGNVHFTIHKADVKEDRTEPVDPKDPSQRDAYRILTLTNEMFEYEHLDTGDRFTARKVTSDFRFPE